ncbi:MAG: hypothetical protein GIKADHBN_02016 [Phycisphaerales bacterium]|nr:hypothetical protein [Phycisphaerales bacterium]
MLVGLCIPVLAALLALVSPGAAATDRFFPDIRATSPDGKYILDAKSPMNADPTKRHAFQKDFTYTLSDAKGATLWQFKQGEGDASPVEAWVHDSGWVVVRTGWDELLACNPANGKITGKVSILDQFSKEDRDKHVSMSTAGPIWAESSRWYFRHIEGSLCFVVRAHWGARVVLELASGRVIADGGSTKASTQAAEHAWIIDQLKQHLPLMLRPDVNECTRAEQDLIRETCTAIDLAGREGLKEAVPTLIELEKSVYAGESGLIPVFFGSKKLDEGLIDPFSYGKYTARAKARAALRRLGTVPSDLPVFAFCRRVNGKSEYYEPQAATEPRRDALQRIVPGMTPEQVLSLVNGPDDLVRPQRDIGWDYHVGLADGYTLRVIWKQENPPVVDRVDKVVPPAWTVSEEPE